MLTFLGRFTVWVCLAGAEAATLRGLAALGCDADVSGMIPIPSWVAMALSVFAFMGCWRPALNFIAG